MSTSSSDSCVEPEDPSELYIKKSELIDQINALQKDFPSGNREGFLWESTIEDLYDTLKRIQGANEIVDMMRGLYSTGISNILLE